jgi:hypothetical protein
MVWQCTSAIIIAPDVRDLDKRLFGSNRLVDWVAGYFAKRRLSTPFIRKFVLASA